MQTQKQDALCYGDPAGDVHPVCVPELVQGHDDINLFFEGDDLYEAMLASIDGATRSVWLETFIFADDGVGRRFASRLKKRAGDGLDVRLCVDAAGSLFWGFDKLAEQLQQAGVRVRLFHRWDWRQPLKYNRRNHRKLLIIDSEEAYLGGFNIHTENSLSRYGPERWRDSHARVSGVLAKQAASMFGAFWNGAHAWQPQLNDKAASVIIANQSRHCRQVLHCLFLEAFGVAARSAYITTPYFVPDWRLQQCMMRAAGSGVDVRLLVPEKGDNRLVRWAGRAAYAPLIEAGVRIFEYGPRILHAKTAVVDGAWASIGSANMDYRSLFLNYELNLITRDYNACRVLQARFLEDLRSSVEIDARAIGKTGWSDTVRSGIGWLARRWL